MTEPAGKAGASSDSLSLKPTPLNITPPPDTGAQSVLNGKEVFIVPGAIGKPISPSPVFIFNLAIHTYMPGIAVVLFLVIVTPILVIFVRKWKR